MKICKLGVWDDSIPGVSFDEDGVSNYAKIQQALMKEYPRGSEGEEQWEKIIQEVKNSKSKSSYDCIVGMSGGVDSSYLLHLLKKEYGLNPLAVNLDNGWNSDIAVKNIKKMTTQLDIDLETHVVEYEEMKDLLRAYLLSGLPWIDTPTDMAIKSLMYKIAREEGVKYIFRGNDFRSEGKQPLEWTYSDDRQVRYVHKTFGRLKKLKSYPYLSLANIVTNGVLYKIKDIRPYYYLEYHKESAKKFLEDNYGWEYYGGHHHENLFTKFVMSYWLPEKFNIDKRKINLSAQVLSGQISREDALFELTQPFDSKENIEKSKEFVLSKLDLTIDEFDEIWNAPNKTYRDYPSNLKFIEFLKEKFGGLIKFVYPQKPMTFVAMEINKSISDEKKR